MALSESSRSYANSPVMDELESRLLLSGATAVTADYFPLDVGLTWTYQANDSGQPDSTETVQTLAETFNGRDVITWFSPYGNGGWERNFFRLVNGELYNDGDQDRDQDEWDGNTYWYTQTNVSNPPARIFPAVIQLGATYTSNTAVACTWEQEGQPADTSTATHQQSFTFVGWENVTTSLGVIHCAKMQTYDTWVETDYHSVDNGFIWFANGVGLVKEARTEQEWEDGVYQGIDTHGKVLTAFSGGVGADLVLADAHFTAPQNVPAATPLSVLAGRQVTFTATVRNDGNMTANIPGNLQGFDVSAAIRPDTDFSQVTDQDVIGRQFVSSLAAGLSATKTFTFTAPATPGRYYVGVAADWKEHVVETDNDNNGNSPLLVLDVAEAFVDLTGTFGTVALPAATTSGNGQRFLTTVRVGNVGNVPVPAGRVADISFYARRVGAADVLVGQLNNQLVASIAPGVSRMFATYLALPAGLETGTYSLAVYVDSADEVDEPGNPGDAGYDDNNWAVTTATMNVTAGFYDLGGVFGTIGLPGAIVAGQPLRGLVQVLVRNLGNIRVPLGQKVNLDILAVNRADPGNPVTLVSQTNVPFAAAPGSQQLLSPYVNRLAGLPAGQYDLQARITPVPALDESDGNNNLVTTNQAAATFTVVSAPPFVDLTAGFGPLSFRTAATSGTTALFVLPVKVANGGNSATAATQKMDIAIYARRDGAADVLVKTLTNQFVGSLGAGISRFYTAIFTLPVGMDSGTYSFVADVDSGNAVLESDDTNNQAVTARTTNVTRGFVDIAAWIGDRTTLPPAVVADGRLTGWFYVTLRNLGNVALPVGQRVNVQLLAHDTGADTDTVLAGVLMPVSALPPTGTSTFAAYVNRLAGLPAGNYELRAGVTPNPALTDENPANDNAMTNLAGNPVTLVSAPAFVDLAGTFGIVTLPGNAVANRLLYGYVGVSYRNLGNSPVPIGTRMNIRVFARSAGGDTDLALLTNLYIGLMPPNQTRVAYVVVNRPAGLPAGNYQILAELLPQGLAESDLANNLIAVNGGGNAVNLTVA